MLDFTSALYLGMQHPSWTLPPWSSLTLGKPAALEDPPGTKELEIQLAALTGCEAVVLESSTLHAFFDLFAMLSGPEWLIFIDRNSYPISRWAAQRSAREAKVRFFGTGNLQELADALRHTCGARPIIVTDGIDPGTGVPAPVAQYATLAADYGGLVVVDDTQALGILGHSPNRGCAYGFGGGGLLQFAGVRSNEVVLVSSLAKAFGVPVAMVGGSKALISRLRNHSLMRKHCSPPSAAVIGAAAQAVEQNRHRGDSLRARLLRNVARLRSGFRGVGLAIGRSLFPVQALAMAREAATSLHRELLQHGVCTVLQKNHAYGAQLSFLVTARHSFGEIDEGLARLASVSQRRARMIGVSSYDSRSQF